jgi:3-dehydroquinate dehydratase-2
MRLKIINGPNLNMLGKREPAIYGQSSLIDIENKIKEDFKNVDFEFFQSNYEGDIIEQIQKSAEEDVLGIVLNAGALTHYSYAIRDAIAAIDKPVIEVHLSNIFKREEFRHNSVLSDVCVGIISGFDIMSYELAIMYFQKNY